MPDPDPTPRSHVDIVTDLARRASETPSGSEILSECMAIADLLIGKNKLYGDAALDPLRAFSRADPVEQIRVRLDDKVSRVARGSQGDEDVVGDLMGYLVLLRIAEKRAAHGHIQHRDGEGDHGGLRGRGSYGRGSRGRVEAHEAGADKDVERPGPGGGRRDSASAGSGMRPQLHVPGFGYVTDLRDESEALASAGLSAAQGTPQCSEVNTGPPTLTGVVAQIRRQHTLLDALAYLKALHTTSTPPELADPEVVTRLRRELSDAKEVERGQSIKLAEAYQNLNTLRRAEPSTVVCPFEGCGSERTEWIEATHFHKCLVCGRVIDTTLTKEQRKGFNETEAKLVDEPMDASRPLTEIEATSPDPDMAAYLFSEEPVTQEDGTVICNPTPKQREFFEKKDWEGLNMTLRAFGPEDAFEPVGAEELVAHGVIGPELGALLGPESHPPAGSVEFVPIESPGEEEDPHMTATWANKAADQNAPQARLGGMDYRVNPPQPFVVPYEPEPCARKYTIEYADYDCQRCQKTKPLKGHAICEGCLKETRGPSGGKIVEKTSERALRG